MMLALKCLGNGCYLTVDKAGEPSLTDTLGFVGTTWLGPVAMELEYVEYSVPEEPSYGYGGWRGLRNPLEAVSNLLLKWEGMEQKLKEAQLTLVPIIAEPKEIKVHPAAVAGLQISVERWGKDPNSWPRGGGGPSILHPGAVQADAAEVMNGDHLDTTRVARNEGLASTLEIMVEVKEALQEELLSTNCAALQDDGRPEDGKPPQAGSLEHLRALHFPSTRATGFVRALLVLLGEPADSLKTWEACRGHLVFRDQRNPWRNVHDRLEAFDPATVPAATLLVAADLVRKAGGEPMARKEWLSVYLVYKWCVLMMLMSKVAQLQHRFEPGMPRPRVEPEDLPNEDDMPEEGQEADDAGEE